MFLIKASVSDQRLESLSKFFGDEGLGFLPDGTAVLMDLKGGEGGRYHLGSILISCAPVPKMDFPVSLPPPNNPVIDGYTLEGVANVHGPDIGLWSSDAKDSAIVAYIRRNPNGEPVADIIATVPFAGNMISALGAVDAPIMGVDVLQTPTSGKSLIWQRIMVFTNKDQS